MFHEQDESLYEWEKLWYGEKSSIIYLYDDYTIEWEGLQWARNFSCYTSTGRLSRVFDRYSSQGDLPDGGDYREYMVYEYQEGIRVKELKITEGWSDDGTYLGVFESKAEEEEFDRVHDGFIDALGERKELNFSEGGFDDAPTVTRKEIMNGFQFIESPVGSITPEIMPYVKEYVGFYDIQSENWKEISVDRYTTDYKPYEFYSSMQLDEDEILKNVDLLGHEDAGWEMQEERFAFFDPTSDIAYPWITKQIIDGKIYYYVISGFSPNNPNNSNDRVLFLVKESNEGKYEIVKAYYLVADLKLVIYEG